MNAEFILLILFALITTVHGKSSVYGKVEIALVVDGSGSVRHRNFNLVKIWLMNVTTAIVDEFGDSVRLVAVQYSSRNLFAIAFKLWECATVDCMTGKIQTMAYLGGYTYTYGVLKKVKQDEFPSSDWYPNSKKFIVLLTDGKATDGEFLSKWYSESTSANITTFAIGVANYNLTQLNLVANGGKSENKGDRVMTLHNFKELQSSVSNITQSIVKEIIAENQKRKKRGGRGGAVLPHQNPCGFSLTFLVSWCACVKAGFC